jgi:outer membrane lipoprotein SlyB
LAKHSLTSRLIPSLLRNFRKIQIGLTGIKTVTEYFWTMKKTILQVATISSFLLGISACASQRPVLSSNAHLMRVGPDVGERDIEECIARAKAASSEGGETSKEQVIAGTATGSVVGAAAGGAGGAVVGRAGQGAAAGAAGGAAASLTQAILQGLFQSKPPDPSYRQLVDRCLREKGYEPAGWK